MQAFSNIWKSMWYATVTNPKKEKEKYMIISIDAEKSFDNIQHLFMILKNIPQKKGIEETCLSIIKANILETHS